MAFSQRLEVKTSQSLVMTPQLQQAIKLLQLSQIDLATFVETELEQNPVLMRDEGDGPQGNSETAPAVDAAAETGDRPTAVDRELGQGDGQLGEQASALGEGYDNVFGNDAKTDQVATNDGFDEALSAGSWASVNGGGRGDSDDDFSGEARLASAVSLRDHLNGQLADLGLGNAERLIGGALIDSVDDIGYLTEAVADLAERLGVDEAMVEGVLDKLQGLDPAGCFARSLKECLTLQCQEADRLDPAMASVLDNLELVAKRDIAGLARLAQVDEEDIRDIITEIRALNPKPGLAFDTTPVQTVVADVFIRPAQDGGWAIDLNGDSLPRVLIDRRYSARVTNLSDRVDKAYLNDCINSANWLIKALDQRARTILKVATSLVRQQDGFLRHGIGWLKPMNLRAIAEEIGMHESTVSRVTTNKWLATPRGLFEMKFFFTSAIASAHGGDAHSAETVRHRIRQMIDGENPKAILSDDKLTDLLKKEGIDIARRTVAKYREAMTIGSSTERRRQKNALGRD